MEIKKVRRDELPRLLYRFRFFKGNMQESEVEFMEKVLLPTLRFQLMRITQSRHIIDDHSFNDFLNDMGCIFLSKVNKWVEEIKK